MAVIIGQKANAYACRSATRWPGALGWTGNRLLMAAGAIEVGISLAVLFPDVIARELEHAPPSATGWAVAVASAPVLLAVDALHKRRTRADQQRRGTST
jgi:hypothetical protein